MPVFGKEFTITGVANVTTEDAVGLASTPAEVKHCDEIIISVSGQVGNTIEVWLDRNKRFVVSDYHLDTDEAADGANAYKSTSKMSRIPVDLDIPVGSVLAVAITCGGTAKNVRGTYVYKLAG